MISLTKERWCLFIPSDQITLAENFFFAHERTFVRQSAEIRTFCNTATADLSCNWLKD